MGTDNKIKLDPATERSLAAKHEGGLFAHVWLIKIGNQISVTKDLYTVQNGQVLIIERNKEGKQQLTPSGDTVLDIETQCKRVGKFNPNKSYRRKIRDYEFKEFIKIHKL